MKPKENSFQLSDVNVYSIQYHNAKKYQANSLLGKFGFILGGFISIFVMLLKWFFDYNVARQVPYFFVTGIASACLIGVLGTLFFARCPNCRSVQPGTSISIFNIGVSYQKGISPWARRCVKCGYYLSVNQLEKDRAIFSEKLKSGV